MFTDSHLLQNNQSTWMSSNLRPTIRDCMHVVMRGHFRSRDKDGGRTIRSAVGENAMLHAGVMAICFIEPELLPIDVLHCCNSHFLHLFDSCDLDFKQVNFIYELDRHSLEIYQICRYELPTSRLSTDRQTVCLTLAAYVYYYYYYYYYY